jgi:hypothetical protein
MERTTGAKSARHLGFAGEGCVAAVAHLKASRRRVISVTASCLGAVACATTLAPAAASAAGFGVTEPHFQIGTCNVVACMYEALESELSERHGVQDLAYTQAAGHPPYGLVGFEFNSEPVSSLFFGSAKKPLGTVKNLRVDIPPGLAANPQALPEKCPVPKFEKNECNGTEQAGEDELEVYVEVPGFGGDNLLLTGAPVYELEPPTPAPGATGLPLDFGIHVNLSADLSHLSGLGASPLADLHIFLEGHLSWHREPEAQQRGVASGDYHEWFTIDNIPNEADGIPVSILKNKLIFFGNRSGSGFLTLPSQCSPHVVGHLFVEAYAGAGAEAPTSEAFTTTPVGAEGCSNVPFTPAISVTPGTEGEGGSATSDAADGTTVEVAVPQQPVDQINSAEPRQITVTLPAGMSLNPAAARGLQACSNAQFGIAPEGPAPADAPPVVEGVQQDGQSAAAPLDCPVASKIGTLAIETPDLPAGSLQGGVYLGEPLSSDPESGVEYRILLAAESALQGVGVRLVGDVQANASTGRLTATIQAPQIPFSDAVMRLRSGPRAPLANPLACNPTSSAGSLVPYGETQAGTTIPALAQPESPFAALGCAEPVAFAPVQTLAEQSTQAGGSSAVTLTLSRPEGQLYPSSLSTTLPAGLLASIASVPALCTEAQAAAAACPASSQIGTVRATLGSGAEPLEVPAANEAPGAVYLTGPYEGAPYGLAVVLGAEHIGPYDFGQILTRATVALDPRTARVTATVVHSYVLANGAAAQASTALPTIVGGIPVRLRSLSLAFSRPAFMLNPTSCAALRDEGQVGGVLTLPAVASAETIDALSTPFQATGCGALAFTPGVTATTSAHASRLDGASLTVSVTPLAGQANVRELSVTLPPQLVSRDSTLVQACSEAQFAASPSGCPAGSKVGTATLQTPLLAAPLAGTGYLVAAGGSAFPNLVFVLTGDGLTLVEEGHTNITHGVTTSTFPELPDAPFSRFSATFAMGPNSLLSANGSLCTQTVRTRRRVVVRRHGRPQRRHGHLLYRTRTVTHVVALKLAMPTTLVAQDGARISRTTTVTVSGCHAAPKHAKPSKKRRVRLRVGLRLRGHTVLLTIFVPSAGHVTVHRTGAAAVSRYVSSRRTITISLPLSDAGIRALMHAPQRRPALSVTFKYAAADLERRSKHRRR